MRVTLSLHDGSNNLVSEVVHYIKGHDEYIDVMQDLIDDSLKPILQAVIDAKRRDWDGELEDLDA